MDESDSSHTSRSVGERSGRSMLASVFLRDFLLIVVHLCFFFFSSRRRHTRFDCDWSSDVCSSDLWLATGAPRSVISKGTSPLVAGVIVTSISPPPAG